MTNLAFAVNKYNMVASKAKVKLDHSSIRSRLINIQEMAAAAMRQLERLTEPSFSAASKLISAIEDEGHLAWMEIRALQDYFEDHPDLFKSSVHPYGFCQYHGQAYQELFPDEMMCEGCFEEAHNACPVCHQPSENGHCRNCTEAYNEAASE